MTGNAVNERMLTCRYCPFEVPAFVGIHERHSNLGALILHAEEEHPAEMLLVEKLIDAVIDF